MVWCITVTSAPLKPRGWTGDTGGAGEAVSRAAMVTPPEGQAVGMAIPYGNSQSKVFGEFCFVPSPFERPRRGRLPLPPPLLHRLRDEHLRHLFSEQGRGGRTVPRRAGGCCPARLPLVHSGSDVTDGGSVLTAVLGLFLKLQRLFVSFKAMTSF